MKSTYEKLVDFWNSNFKLTKEYQEELKAAKWQDLAPSEKFLDVLKELKCHVLDYGAGAGWASVMLAKMNADKVTSAEVSINAIDVIKYYSEAFEVSDKIIPLHIDENWLGNEEENKYDGFFSSNVIDVIPLEMSKEIIRSSALVTKKDATTIFSLNYYIDNELLDKLGYEHEGPHIFMDGVLRLTSLSDEEWTELFKQYYKDVKLIYFAWPGEKSEKRRLFILKK